MTQLKLSTGSNTFIVLAKRREIPGLLDRIMIVAHAVSSLLGTIPFYIGKEGTTLVNSYVFMIGEGRPVHIYELGKSQNLVQFNLKQGEPFGPEPYYYSVNIEWRGSPQTFSRLIDPNVYIPQLEPVTGAPGWPDGDIAAQKKLIEVRQSAQESALTAAVIRDMTDTATVTVKKVVSGSMLPLFLLGFAGFGLWLLLREAKTIKLS